ncbi:protein FAM168A isoform X1 [Loxodonta africana]
MERDSMCISVIFPHHQILVLHRHFPASLPADPNLLALGKSDRSQIHHPYKTICFQTCSCCPEQLQPNTTGMIYSSLGNICAPTFWQSTVSALHFLKNPAQVASCTVKDASGLEMADGQVEDPQSSTMNPVYSPVQPGAPYGNPKNMAYTGYPTAYPAAAPAYNPSLYPTNSPSYAPEFQFLHSAYATLLMKQAWPQNSSSCGPEGTFHLPVDTGTENRTYQASSAAFRYTAGTPYKVPPTQSNTAPPPYSPSPNPYQTAMYPIRSAYPQQNLYAQGAYYTQPVYAAQPHVIHHTTVVQPNSIPSAIYPAPVAAPRTNGVAMGMVAGTTMAMSAGTLLTTPQHTAIGAHPVSMPTYRAQGTPAYSYVPPHW